MDVVILVVIYSYHVSCANDLTTNSYQILYLKTLTYMVGIDIRISKILNIPPAIISIIGGVVWWGEEVGYCPGGLERGEG